MEDVLHGKKDMEPLMKCLIFQLLGSTQVVQLILTYII